MKNYLKMTKDGFTLVELMIVVAIIGVLASIAVPQYSKFQAKSRQSEVRIQLGATYTVEQSFAAENSTYTLCLGQTGYNRDGTKFYYTIGFDDTSAGATTSCQPGAAGVGACTVYQWQFDNTVTPAAYAAGATCSVAPLSTQFPANIAEPGNSPTTQAYLTGSGAAITSSISGSTFVIGGAGFILSKAAKADGWTIDNNKQILNTQSGLQ
jgi:type IV pilus assembly protein PilA